MANHSIILAVLISEIALLRTGFVPSFLTRGAKYNGSAHLRRARPGQEVKHGTTVEEWQGKAAEWQSVVNRIGDQRRPFRTRRPEIANLVFTRVPAWVV